MSPFFTATLGKGRVLTYAWKGLNFVAGMTLHEIQTNVLPSRMDSKQIPTTQYNPTPIHTYMYVRIYIHVHMQAHVHTCMYIYVACPRQAHAVLSGTCNRFVGSRTVA